MSVIDLVNRLKSEILPRAIQDGSFGTDKIKFIDFIRDEIDAQDQFQSEVIFGDVVMTTKNDEKCFQSVVIKVQPFIKQRTCPDLDNHFYREHLFYSEIVPFFKKHDGANVIGKYFPNFFFGIATRGEAPEKDILIFENLQKLKFQLASSRSFISYDHIKLTLESIAEFHSLSIVCKKRDPEGVKRIVTKLVETRWTEKRVQEDTPFFRETCKRGISPFQNDPDYKDKLSEMLALVENVGLFMKKSVTRVEPLAVICHGDLCRNNIFYRYDADGKPTAIKFFDLAAIRYSSPIIDLSFFLFMNCSPEERSQNWERILSTYHTALKSNPDVDERDCPTLEDIRIDFQRRGFYGYTYCSFFLPMMLEDEHENKSEKANLSDDELLALRLRTGGQRATDCVAQIVKHMIDQKFDFKYIMDLEFDH